MKKKSKMGYAGGKKTKMGYAGGKKTKMGMAGGRRTKMGMAGGKKTKMSTKMMASGKSTKMPMSKDPRTGEMVPSFTVDGKGKMMGGGKPMSMMTKDGVRMSPKMMANGGGTMLDRKNGGNTVARGSGAARTQKFTKNG